MHCDGVISRLARKERDIRAIEARLKQYETEIGELKGQNDAFGFDLNRKTDENVVSWTTREAFGSENCLIVCEMTTSLCTVSFEGFTWCEW